MLKPLEQWICDHCGQVVENSKAGWLEWVDRENKTYGFKIVHHASASPRKPNGDCYHYTHERGRADNHLYEYDEPHRMGRLLSLLDVGTIHDAEAKHVPGVKDLREWTELVRRMTIPYYEEARFHFGEAEADGFFDGANELWVYHPYPAGPPRPDHPSRMKGASG